MTEIMDGATIAEAFAATITAPTGRSWPCPP